MKKRALIAVLLTAAIAVTGCGAATNDAGTAATNDAATNDAQSTEAATDTSEAAVNDETETNDSTDESLAKEDFLSMDNDGYSEADEYRKSTEAGEYEVIARYEAEDAKLSDEVVVDSSLAGFSGDGYAHVASQTFEISFDVEVPDEGQYVLSFISAGIGGYKENIVSVDGEQAGNIITDEAGVWNSSEIAGVYMSAGAHTITVTPSWAWFELDCMDILTDSGISENVFNVSAETVNPNATKEAKAIKAYLAEQYGKKVLSGQVSDYGVSGVEYSYINELTGEYPAILGLDFMNYSGYAQQNGATAISTTVAINYWNDYNGISTFCWHWFAPAKFHKQGQWYKTFSKENVDMDLNAIMNGEDEESYQLLMDDIDRIAEQIAVLQDAGVPILFRPLHEASGGWFWWGNYGADAYKRLYITIFKKLTYEHGLNNIIWLWNGQDSEWYPGDEYVDIIGTDIYANGNDYSSRVSYFNDCLDASENYNRIICQSECGTLSDVDLMFRDGAKWSYWCTWSGDFCTSENYTSKEEIKKIYADDRVINLGDLPNFKEQ